MIKSTGKTYILNENYLSFMEYSKYKKRNYMVIVRPLIYVLPAYTYMAVNIGTLETRILYLYFLNKYVFGIRTSILHMRILYIVW